eukprot:496515-Pelagomonas_calceolata.AAC.3
MESQVSRQKHSHEDRNEKASAGKGHLACSSGALECGLDHKVSVAILYKKGWGWPTARGSGPQKNKLWLAKADPNFIGYTYKNWEAVQPSDGGERKMLNQACIVIMSAFKEGRQGVLLLTGRTGRPCSPAPETGMPCSPVTEFSGRCGNKPLAIF